MKKIISIFILLFLFIINVKAVNAEGVETVRTGPYINGVFIKKILDNKTYYLQSQYIIRNQDGNFIYCLDPFSDLDTNVNYVTSNTNQAKISGISVDKWQRIQALIYFGYGYGNHYEVSWYSITQVAIWQLLRPDAQIFFTDKLNGTKTTKFDAKLAELNDLANNYLKVTKVPDITINYQDTKVITDDNLLGYHLLSNDSNITLANNNLTVKANFTGTREYEIVKGDNNSILFHQDNTQSLIYSKQAPYLTNKIKVTVTDGVFNLKFKMPKLHHSNCTSKANTVYGLYNAKDELLETYDLNKSLIFTSLTLPYGNYYVKEISHACNLLKDTNIYSYNLDRNSKDINIDLAEKVKTINLKKLACIGNTCQNEPQATFIIQDKTKTFKLTTDNKGLANLTLGMGTYNLKQISGLKDYELSQELTIDFNKYQEDVINLKLQDNIKKGNIKVTVVNENNEIIPNSLICLNVNNSLKCQKTNEQGITEYANLNYGNYNLKEENTPQPYLVNDTDYKVILNGNTLIKIVNQQEPIKEEKQPIITEDNTEQDIVNPETAIMDNSYLIILSISIIALLFSLVKIS
jgi:hypothetical protein